MVCPRHGINPGHHLDYQLREELSRDAKTGRASLLLYPDVREMAEKSEESDGASDSTTAPPSNRDVRSFLGEPIREAL